MLNIHDLEKRWLQYKIKSYIPYIVLALSTIFIITAGFFFLTQEKNEKKEVTTITNKNIQKNSTKIIKKDFDKNISSPKEQNNSTKNAIAKQAIYTPVTHNKTPHKTSSTTSIKENKTHVLKPSMNFMKNLQSETPHYYNYEEESIKKQNKKRTYISQQKAPVEEYIEVQAPVTETKTKPETPKKVATPIQATTTTKIVPEVKSQITIKRRESQNDIKDVIKRFQKNNNPALSLFVAKKYYELGNYRQAYNYALVTNKINNDIEESWLIFAKSLVKLGKKDQALKTLQEYINYSHSANAQVLFDEIQRGKFK